MSIQWLDSFEQYGTGSTGQTNMLAGPYAQLTGSGSLTVAPADDLARTGTISLAFGSHNSNTQFRRAFSQDLTDVTVGYAIYMDNLPSNDAFMLGSFKTASTGTDQFSFQCNAVGGIEAWTGKWNDGNLVAETGPVLFPLGWMYIEMQVHHDPDPTLGSFKVRVNNIEVMSETGVNTNAYSSQFTIDSGGSAVANPHADFHMDDLYCTDSFGSANTGFLGDVRIYTLGPTGDTVSAGWTPSTGSSLYQMVDEIPPDGDSTYNSANTAGLKYTLDMDDLPSDVVNVYGVVATAMLRKADPGSCGVTISVDSSGTLADGTEKSISTGYLYWQDVFDQDPNVSGAWTRTTVNSAKMKLEKTT